jgi:hypothetical protein
MAHRRNQSGGRVRPADARHRSRQGIVDPARGLHGTSKTIVNLF